MVEFNEGLRGWLKDVEETYYEVANDVGFDEAVDLFYEVMEDFLEKWKDEGISGFYSKDTKSYFITDGREYFSVRLKMGDLLISKINREKYNTEQSKLKRDAIEIS